MKAREWSVSLVYRAAILITHLESFRELRPILGCPAAVQVRWVVNGSAD